MKINYLKYSSIFAMAFILGCNKYLDTKSDASLVIPQSITDLQALLDNNNIMNIAGDYYGEGSADNFYLTYDNWASLSTDAYKNLYIWGDELAYGTYNNPWTNTYGLVYYANLVLDNIDDFQRTNTNASQWDNAKGSALFFRAWGHYVAACNWAVAYDSITASTDLGVPIRSSSDFNVISTRASVQQTYDAILSDLNQSVALLPIAPTHVMRPSRPAAYALLARVYLSMRKYRQALDCADSCLIRYNELLDYNSLSTTATNPIAAYNKEVLFNATAPSPPNLSRTRASVDSFLYLSFNSNDLRKSVFFVINNSNGSYNFKGNYTGGTTLFTGLAVDEVYLIKAEAAARLGNTAGAVNAINTLLVNRYKKGTYIPWTSFGTDDLIDKILNERQKELIRRDLRWMDVKRLNKGNAGISLKRMLNGQVYELQANSSKFALPIPAYVIDQSGMQQNPR